MFQKMEMVINKSVKRYFKSMQPAYSLTVGNLPVGCQMFHKGCLESRQRYPSRPCGTRLFPASIVQEVSPTKLSLPKNQ